MKERTAKKEVICFTFYCPLEKVNLVQGITNELSIFTNDERNAANINDGSDLSSPTGVIFEGICTRSDYVALKETLQQYAFRKDEGIFIKKPSIKDLPLLYKSKGS